MARRSRILSAPLLLLRLMSKTVLTTLFLLMLLLNAGMVMVPAVFAVVSGVVESLVGARTVRAAHVAEADDLRARNSNLMTRGDTLARENAQLKNDLEKTRVHYRGDRKLAKEAVSDTSERIRRRVTFATARNTASMAGEALPFIGVAVIVGATAWEVSDACEMMKDLHQLDVAFNPENALDERELCGMEVPTAIELWTRVAESPGEVWESMTATYEDLPEVSFTSGYGWLLARGGDFLVWIGIGGEGEDEGTSE